MSAEDLTPDLAAEQKLAAAIRDNLLILLVGEVGGWVRVSPGLLNRQKSFVLVGRQDEAGHYIFELEKKQ